MKGICQLICKSTFELQQKLKKADYETAYRCHWYFIYLFILHGAKGHRLDKEFPF